MPHRKLKTARGRENEREWNERERVIREEDLRIFFNNPMN